MDAETFKAIILSRYEDMYRMAYAIVQDREDAQDAVQDAVTRLWARRDELASVESPVAFCMTAVKHQCIDMLRERARRHTMSEPHDDESDTPADDTAARVEDADTLHLAERMVDMLPPAQKRVLRLRCHAECSVDEIADITGYSPANVRQLLSRARRCLKQLFMKHL